MTQAFNYSGVARETIYSALATQLQSVMGLAAVYRARMNIATLNANTSPVGCLMQATSKAYRPREFAPTRYVDTAVLAVGVAQQSTDPNFVASTALNNLRDLLDLSLIHDNPSLGTCTLGGIVDYCRPMVDTYAETLQNDVWTAFVTTIEFLYTPAHLI